VTRFQYYISGNYYIILLAVHSNLLQLCSAWRVSLHVSFSWAAVFPIVCSLINDSSPKEISASDSKQSSISKETVNSFIE